MTALLKKIWDYKKWLIAVLVVAGAAQLTYSWYLNQNKPAATVRVIKIERGDLTAVVSATGTIEPVNSVDVSSKITGLIKEVRVLENNHVQAGQVLVVIDDTHLQALVTQAQSKLTNALANYTRLEKLAASGAIALQQFDSAKMDYLVAKAAQEDAVAQLEDTVIKAPIDGIVIGKPIPAGQTVAPGISTPMVLMTVADMSQMQIKTQVDESDIGKVTEGQAVSFTVDAYPGRTFYGEVTSISHKANIQQNVVYYPVIINVNESSGLKPTMTARVTIHVGEVQNALLVPLTAVKENKAGRYVQVLRDGQPQSAIITTGLMNDEKVEVLSGLKDGDQIVLPQSRTQGGQTGTTPSVRTMMGR